MKSTAKEWDDVRTAFATSIMVDTALNSLAQNLDRPDWPIKGKNETPASYIDLTFEEATEMLQLKGQPPERIDQLTGILKDTLEFDSPFGDMVEQTVVASARDNQLLKNLTKLEIPENFPITLTALDASTLEFCKLEKLATLGEFAIFAQSMAQNVIVGGDFKKLLNALSHIDEKALAEVLPFRKGSRGLHLVEALAQAARGPAPQARAEGATNWFRMDLVAIENDVAKGGSLARHFVILGDPALEKEAADLLIPHLRQAPAKAKEKPPAPRAPAESKKGGLFGWLFKK